MGRAVQAIAHHFLLSHIILRQKSKTARQTFILFAGGDSKTAPLSGGRCGVASFEHFVIAVHPRSVFQTKLPAAGGVHASGVVRGNSFP